MKIKLLSLALALMVGLLACGSREGKARLLYNEAITAERNGKPGEYENLLEKIVEEYGSTQVAIEANKQLTVIRRGRRTLRTAAAAQIGSFQMALRIYKLDTSTYPTTEQGLRALREKPPGVAFWDGPYLPQDAPDDPWESPYDYEFPGKHSDEPDIVSYGADGRPGGAGEDADIVSWSSP